ncbi:MAG: FAD-dependent oxidoreductase, partial [Deltaproteobacteria bacterium]|nr:FAD-dependent oxidoreductase [Deltaproteobacteria bacterium]
FEMHPAEKARKVLVVGAGPAGMEAARVAALRGHKVTLCEKEPRLGGTAFLSSLVNLENGRLIDYLATQIRTLPIDLQLNRTVTPDFISQFKPDVILLALGTKEEIPSIPGFERRNVFSGEDMHSLLMGGDSQVLKKLSLMQRVLVNGGRLMGVSRNPAIVRKMSKLWMPMGNRVVIMGGGLVGVELAEFLVERGRRVTVLEESDSIAAQMAIPRRWRVLYHLRERGVSLLSGVTVQEILEDRVAYETKKGDMETVEADSVILASGTVPDQDLFETVSALCPDVRLLGDCNVVAYIEGAMADGARAGNAI